MTRTQGIDTVLARLASVSTVLLAVGSAGIFLASVGAVTWLATAAAPVWTVIVGAALALLLVLFAFDIGVRRGWVAAEAERPDTESAVRARARTVAELHTAGRYVSQIDDFLSEVQSSFGAAPAEALHALDHLRGAVCAGVIRAAAVSRGDRIRCVLFVPKVDSPGETRLRPAYEMGNRARLRATLALYADHRSVAGLAFQTGRPVYLADAASDPHLQDTGGDKPGTLYCIPVYAIHDDTVHPLGVFSVESERRDAFPAPYDKEFVSVCANVFALTEFLRTVYARMEEK